MLEEVSPSGEFQRAHKAHSGVDCHEDKRGEGRDKERRACGFRRLYVGAENNEQPPAEQPYCNSVFSLQTLGK